MAPSRIKSLFATDIGRDIEEVIKVDQTNEDIIKFEIDEYVLTDAISRHYESILDAYSEAPRKPREGVGIWVSGFFGSGKSSFAKLLGLAIENRQIVGKPAGERFAARVNNKLKVLLNNITEQIPTHAVIFDVSTDRGIRSGNQTLTEIMYRLLLGSLGYAKDLDLAELEISLEGDGELEQFKTAFQALTGKDWDLRKGLISFSLSEASAAMHTLKPKIYPTEDSWASATKGRADITPGLLAKRSTLLMNRRKPGHALLFVVDEVGQFVARDVQKMLDLQAVVQQLGIEGRGKHWLVVTSQEKLGELTAGLDDRQVELARLMDRFPQELQVHLEPSDISEVTSKRVLAKNAAAQTELGALYDEHRGRLADHTKMSADITLPPLTLDSFVDLYPLLPYQVDLIIQVVSGLRTQGGASKHVGGANRTIIKLAQQLLIHPEVGLGESQVGELARLDQVYDLVESNIGSEIRAKIQKIPSQVSHPRAQQVAKAICLLQFVKSVHRTAENIAASLYPSLGAASVLAEVKEALEALEHANLVRNGEDGYRIPTPAEDDWERLRNGTSPKPSDAKRIHREFLGAFWTPQPTFTLEDVRPFKAGLVIDGHEEVKGDIAIHFVFVDETDAERVRGETRTRSQKETDTAFWVVSLDDAIDRETVQLFRSREMESRRGRDSKTSDQAALLAEERARGRRYSAELQRLLRQACLDGSVFFRGNDRSPSGATDVARATTSILGQVLPDVFTRFSEGAAKPADSRKGLDALVVATDLQGLPSVFTALNLLRDEGGKTVFNVDAAALREVFGQIEKAAAEGQTATGRSLADHLAAAPFGWDFDVVRLFVASLIRAGRIQMRHKSEPIDVVTSAAARDALENNTHFRAASFLPKKGVDFAQVVLAGEHFKTTFGHAVKELALSPVVVEIRQAVRGKEDDLQVARELLRSSRLPGLTLLDETIAEMKSISRGTEEDALAAFNASHEKLKDGIRRAAEVSQALTPDVIAALQAAQRCLLTEWSFLRDERDTPQDARDAADGLEDLLQRETFFKDLAAIVAAHATIHGEHQARFNQALNEKVVAYTSALEHLTNLSAWSQLSDDAKAQIAQPLRQHADDDGSTLPAISQMRSDRDACGARLHTATEAVHRVVEGDRIVSLDLQPFFRGGVDTVEQLEAAIEGLREVCERLLADNKKIILK